MYDHRLVVVGECAWNERRTDGVAEQALRDQAGRMAAQALGVVALVLAGVLVLERMRTTDEPTSAAVAATEGLEAGIGPVGDMARRVDGDPLARGPVDAPVVLVVYSDYRCPFCAKFSHDTEPQLVDKYVEAGKLRIEWRDLPIFGEESMVAARPAGPRPRRASSGSSTRLSTPPRRIADIRPSTRPHFGVRGTGRCAGPGSLRA